MKLTRLFLFLNLLLFSLQVKSSVTGYRSTHPVAWMHGLPSGESPGWKDKKWLISEAQLGNYWNAEMDVKDRRTNDIYTYSVDFEQILLQLEAGWALSDHLAVGLALPIVSRFGGVLDQPLDDWHIFVGADRFRRNEFPRHQNNFHMKKNGVEQLPTHAANGLGQATLKMKWWFYKVPASLRPEMEGLATSLQVRLPLRSHSSTLTTGHMEGSVLLHGGYHLSKYAYFWMSAGFTKFAPNPLFQDWPQRQWAQIYETWFEVPLGEKWDLIFQLRYQSPLFNKEHLDFQYSYTTEKYQDSERAASGWNGLTAWRGSDAIGARYRHKNDKSFIFLFQEDWALGDNDGRKNFLYVHGAPDVAFVFQFQTTL